METEILEEIKADVDVQFDTQEEKQTIVHISYQRMSRIRVWSTTYLKDQNSNHLSKLIDSYNVGKHPHWKLLRANEEFTLIFEGLPKGCTSFHLVEEIPEPGGMCYRNISRNNQDVYIIKTQL